MEGTLNWKDYHASGEKNTIREKVLMMSWIIFSSPPPPPHTSIHIRLWISLINVTHDFDPHWTLPLNMTCCPGNRPSGIWYTLVVSCFVVQLEQSFFTIQCNIHLYCTCNNNTNSLLVKSEGCNITTPSVFLPLWSALFFPDVRTFETWKKNEQ